MAGKPGKAERMRENRTLAETGVRRCIICSEIKPLEAFQIAKTGYLDRSGYCNACFAAKQRQKQIDNPEQWTAIRRKSHLRSKFGLSLEDFQTLYAAQAGCCAICETPIPESGRSMHIDHDRSCCSGAASCGQCVRGLLCPPCNVGIAMFADDLTRLHKAIAYIAANSRSTVAKGVT